MRIGSNNNGDTSPGQTTKLEEVTFVQNNTKESVIISESKAEEDKNDDSTF